MNKKIYVKMCIDGQICLNIIKDYNNFLKKIEKLKPYMVQFEEDDIIKAKIYLSNCKARGPN